LAITMKKPFFFTSYLLNVGKITEDRAQEILKDLSRISGVVDVTVIAEDGIAYLKIDKQHVNMDELHCFAAKDETNIL